MFITSFNKEICLKIGCPTKGISLSLLMLNFILGNYNISQIAENKVSEKTNFKKFKHKFMKKYVIKYSAIILSMIIANGCGESSRIKSPEIETQVLLILKNASEHYQNITRNPRNFDEDGSVRFVPSSDWTSGFFPGCLWFAYELSGDSSFLKSADYHSWLIEKEKVNGDTHDMGFKMYCSFGNGYRLTHDERYRKVLIESAYTLATRFNEKVGCTRSWDHNSDKWQFPVIIDNLMNLELLFWAAKETKDSMFYKMAVSHADKTMKEHFRPDYSSYHVVDYDTLTGEAIQKNTHQGFADESAWSRGQAWALYGYTMIYRETGDPKYLEVANHIAKFIFTHPNMPEDLVPYWDFNAPGIPEEPRDASAAAIIASALYELSAYSDEEQKTKYLGYANKIMSSLGSESYFCPQNNEHFFILDHSTGNKPRDSEVDVPIIFADYYYLEALTREKVGK